MEKEHNTISMVMTKKEYLMWLEMSLASAIQALEGANKEIHFLMRKNMQLEDENLATTIALVKNPLRSIREYHA